MCAAGGAPRSRVESAFWRPQPIHRFRAALWEGCLGARPRPRAGRARPARLRGRAAWWAGRARVMWEARRRWGAGAWCHPAGRWLLWLGPLLQPHPHRLHSWFRSGRMNHALPARAHSDPAPAQHRRGRPRAPPSGHLARKSGRGRAARRRSQRKRAAQHHCAAGGRRARRVPLECYCRPPVTN
ncbi:MAG: hypothetical protein J3K34DRAFT_87284 [Monoraphidium minutum]|nr:MAG: hypothetical protein J3K34DRAFT_87284 [Monoraphidium minutum]